MVKASWGVLRADKELLLFPVVSALCTAIVAATFARMSPAKFFSRMSDVMVTAFAIRGLVA